MNPFMPKKYNIFSNQKAFLEYIVLFESHDISSQKGQLGDTTHYWHRIRPMYQNVPKNM